jgi:hypothetical protein
MFRYEKRSPAENMEYSVGGRSSEVSASNHCMSTPASTEKATGRPTKASADPRPPSEDKQAEFKVRSQDQSLPVRHAQGAGLGIS